MKRIELLNIYNIVSGLKIGSVSIDCACTLLEIKIALSDQVKKIEEGRQTALEELRPEGFDPQDKEMIRIYNERFTKFLDKYLNENVSIELGTISQEDIMTLGKQNNLSIAELEVLSLISKK